MDLLGAVKRMIGKGKVAVDEAQLGFGFDEPTPSAASVATSPVAPGAASASAFAPAAASASGTASAPRAASPPAVTSGATPRVAPPPAVSAPRPSRGAAARRAQAATLLHRLHTLGLRGINSVTLMRTRRTMVSVVGTTLRMHEGYATAPEPVLRAVVTFATARTRSARLAARDVILSHPVERPPAQRRAEPVRPGDGPLLARLADAHGELNQTHFGGTLSRIPVRLSGRMKTRLGHYSPAGEDGTGAEIVLSRRHLRRDGWPETLHTLLHEMIHQWQDETERPLDHGPAFRKKAREVGVLPRAKRPVG